MSSYLPEEIKKINEESHPDAGTRVPAGKNRDEKDTLKGSMKKESATEARAIPGACKKAADKQCGKDRDNMTQANSGCDEKN